MEKLTIIGSGCAGLTAAIYAARANLSPLVLEGREPGGQLTTTTLVENFPGFVEGIDGSTLILNLKAQAQRFGARFAYSFVDDLEQANGLTRLKIGNDWLETQALIIASGASARYPGLPGEKALIGHGLTACATCDGAFYRDVPVCVIGGGDSACEEALFLTRFASQVYLIHRRDTLRASKIMADRVLENPKITPIWDSVLREYLADDAGEVRGVRLQNLKTSEERELELKCVFSAIGHTPNTAPFQGKIDLDDAGYILRHQGTQTNLPGIFAAGDVADPHYQQAITAAGQGCAAALEAERWLSQQG